LKVDSSERACFVFIIVVLLGIIGVMLLVPVQIAEPLPEVGTAIGTQTVFVHPTEVAEYVDIRTDIYGVTGLKVIINDEVYWLRLWKEE